MVRCCLTIVGANLFAQSSVSNYCASWARTYSRWNTKLPHLNFPIARDAESLYMFPMSLQLPGSVAGVGIDLIEIDRVRLAHQRHGEAFLHRVFTDAEVAFCFRKLNPFPSLAARFAAKEAAFKALSQVGIRVIRWQDIAVTQDEDGIPSLSVEGILGFNYHLSLSHADKLATAIVVLERIP